MLIADTPYVRNLFITLFWEEPLSDEDRRLSRFTRSGFGRLQLDYVGELQTLPPDATNLLTIAASLSEVPLSAVIDHLDAIAKANSDRYPTFHPLYERNFPAAWISDLFQCIPEPVKNEPLADFKLCISLWSMAQDRHNAVLRITSMGQNRNTISILHRWFCETFLSWGLDGKVIDVSKQWLSNRDRDRFSVQIEIQLARAHLHKGDVYVSMDIWRTVHKTLEHPRTFERNLQRLIFAYGQELIQAQAVVRHEISESDFDLYELGNLLELNIRILITASSLDERDLIPQLSDIVPEHGYLYTKWLGKLDAAISTISLDIREMNPRVKMQCWLKGWTNARATSYKDVLEVCPPRDILVQSQSLRT
jgi:hypothetical protein